MNESNKKRIGVYFDKETIELCDAGLALTQARSRSEFISDAVEFYTTVLMKDHTTKVLTPVLESVIRASILNTENRLSSIIFPFLIKTINYYIKITNFMQIKKRLLYKPLSWCA